MPILVTGATGHLGLLVIEALLERGVPASEIIAGGRNDSRLAALAARGVGTASLDYDEPKTVDAAVSGAEKVLLISSTEVGRRQEQHRNVVDAAVRAGVGHLAYTSGPKADTSPLILAPDHKATEEIIRGAGIPFTILRNNWYTENYVPTAQQAAVTGEVVASAGEGRVASASRADYAEAAAAVLTGNGHEGHTYELSGDHAWDYTELASAIGSIVGREVVYRPVSTEEHVSILVSAGLDEGTAGFVAALDGDTRQGLLADTSGELSRLIGRPTTPLRQGLAAALKTMA